jgi:hypothetical protein
LTEDEQGFGSLEIKRARSFGEAVKNRAQQVMSRLASALSKPVACEAGCGPQFEPSGTLALGRAESLAKILFCLLGSVLHNPEFASEAQQLGMDPILAGLLLRGESLLQQCLCRVPITSHEEPLSGGMSH